MERRRFLKSLLIAGAVLSPISILAEKLPIAQQLPAADLPIIEDEDIAIIIENLSDQVKQNVEIFGSIEYLCHNRFNESGGLEINNVLIQTPADGRSYKNTLFHLLNIPSKPYQMVVESDNVQQVFEPFIIAVNDASGNRCHLPVFPGRYKSPYDEAANSILITNGIWLDGFTKVIFGKLYPKTKLAIRFIPVK